MAEVLLFHHAQGLTPGVVAFADELRSAGHTVHAPDLFEGRTFGSIEEGMTYIKGVGFDKLRQQTNTVVLDVRTPKEFAAGHIPGATNIDWNGADFA